MSYPGLKGNVTVPGYIGWIEIQSTQVGTSRNVASPTGRENRDGPAPSVSEIVVTRIQDSASPGLFQQSLDGRGKKVTIAYVKDGERAGAEPYLKIELENTTVPDYYISGAGGNGRLMESLSLNFTKIEYKTGNLHTMQGNVEVSGWGSATKKP